MRVADLEWRKVTLKATECPAGSVKTFEMGLEQLFARGSRLASALGCTVESPLDWTVARSWVKKLEMLWLWVWESLMGSLLLWV